MNFSEGDYRFVRTILKEHYPGPFKELENVLQTTRMNLGHGHRLTPSEILQRGLGSLG